MDAKPCPWITVKDFAWLLYLYPVRLLARICPLILLTLEPLWLKRSHWLSKGIQQRVRSRMMKAIGAAESERVNGLVSLYLRHYLERIVDDLCLDVLVNRMTKEEVIINGMEHLEQALKQQKGALLLSGHFFASRLVKKILAARGFPMLSVRHQAPQDPCLGKIGKRILQKQYMQFLHGVIGDEVYIQDEDCSLKIMQRLRQGGLVNIHLDGAFATQTISLPYLGGKRYFPVTPLRICQIADSPLVPIWFSGDRRQVKIEFESAMSLDGVEVVDLMKNLVDRLEKRILDQPDQYELWVMLR